MKRKILNTVFILIALVIVIYLHTSAENIPPNIALPLMTVSSILLLASVIHWSMDMLSKGFLLAAIAIGMSILNAEVYKTLAKVENVDDIKIQYEMLKDIMLVAFAGAGGSLIAEHAKLNSKDGGNSGLDTAKIENKVESLEDKIHVLILLIVILIGLVFWLMLNQ